MAGGFEALGLGPELIRAVTSDLGYLLPTNVQDEAIPLMLGGGDVMVAAETGSGKTAAFGLPLLQIIHEDLRRAKGSNGQRQHQSHAARVSIGWRISTIDKDLSIAVSPDGMSCQSRAPQWAGARAQNGVCSGAYFFEAKVDDEGLCRFGWATQDANLNLGTDVHGYGFGGTGMKSYSGKFEEYGEAFCRGDTVGCRLDLVKGEISFTKNNRDLGVAYHLPFGVRGPFFPAVVLKNAQASFNFSPISEHGTEGRFAPISSASPENVISSAMIKEASASKRGRGGVRTPGAIVIEPSRELAEQVSDCLDSFKRHLVDPRLEHILLVGGADVKKDVRTLKGQHCDVVVGTPGRLVNLLEKGALNTSAVRLLVLDEADRLLQADSLDDIMKIHKTLPQHGVGDLRLQVCFFSATLHSPDIGRLSELICDRPTWVDLKGRDSVPDTVHHVVVRVDPDTHASDSSFMAPMNVNRVQANTDGAAVGEGSEGRDEARSERLKRLKPQVLLGVLKALRMDQALIFCRTNLDCDLLEAFLTEVGGGQRFGGARDSGKENAFSCCVLAGMRSQVDRRANLQAFKEGYVRFLICTDVAARGVDIKGLPFVVNMTLPDEPENYIHRIGRVGRQDCLGLAVSIVAADGCKEKVWYHKNCANRGRNCTNRNTLKRGGCTMWYDEPGLLKAVEARIHGPIPELGPSPDYALPVGLSIEADAATGEAVEYGSKIKEGVGSGDRALIEAHVQSLKPTVRELAQLEFEAQNIWLGMMQGCF